MKYRIKEEVLGKVSYFTIQYKRFGFWFELDDESVYYYTLEEALNKVKKAREYQGPVIKYHEVD